TAWDPIRGELLAVGGNRLLVNLNTSAIAAYDGTDWRARTSARLMPLDPPAAWHAGTGRAVVFGGKPSLLGVWSATYLFDGSRWRLAAPTVTPPARYAHLLVADSRRDRVVMF